MQAVSNECGRVGGGRIRDFDCSRCIMKYEGLVMALLVMADVRGFVLSSLSHNHHTVVCAVGMNDALLLIWIHTPLVQPVSNV